MKKTFLALIAILMISLSVSAQRIEKPTRMGSEPTAEQWKILQEGVAFHDKKRYDEAIAKYKQVLEANNDCVIAMYELALTYYTAKQLTNAFDVALVGSTYKSEQLPLFYGIIANVLDDQGNPVKAIQLYKDAIKIIGDDPQFSSHLSSLYFNLGVTYARQSMFDDARQVLKKAVELNFSYASPNYLLAVVFYQTKYKIPALLAAGRLVSLETNSQRSALAVKIINDILGGNVQPGDEPGSVTITINPDAPTDEGDFGAIELFLGLSRAGSETEDKNKTDEEKFVGRFERFVNILLETNDKKLRDTFVGKTYIPFFAEMKRRGDVKTFAYLILQQSGNKTGLEWIVENKEKTVAFLEWSKAYKL